MSDIPPTPCHAPAPGLLSDVVLRIAHPDDAPAIAAIYAPFVLETAVSFETEAPDAAEMRRRITSTLDRWPWLVAVEGSGQVLGYAYATRHRERAAYRWAVETSVYLHAAARGRGLGTQLYKALLEELRRLGYRQALAAITLPNPASVRLHESLGFQPAGLFRQVGYKQGAWRDLGWWQHVLSDAADVPDEPRVFSHADWRAT